MKSILAERQRDVLERLAAPGALLAFDYDGTLAPLVSAPSHAHMRAATQRLLALLARRYPCVVITGRARRDVLSFLEGVPLLQVVGSHGAEWGEGSRYEAQIGRLVSLWLDPLRRALGRIAGVALEDKGYSLTVHYRAAKDRRDALAKILRAVEALPASRVIRGPLAVDVVTSIAPDKGSALVALLKRHSAERALFVGDGLTDEGGFSVARVLDVTGVRVGRARGTNAGYFLTCQRMIDELLRRLCNLRVGSHSMGEPRRRPERPSRKAG